MHVYHLAKGQTQIAVFAVAASFCLYLIDRLWIENCLKLSN